MLHVAHSHPEHFVLGVDANATAMMEASRRAVRGGVPNALFAVAAAESFPAELARFADEVTVHFPWGSLLSGLLTADPGILGGVAAVTRPGATVTLLLSVTDHDRLGLRPITAEMLTDLACRYAELGLEMTNARPATVEEVTASRSTWAKRLGVGTKRPAWLLRFERCD